jgi:ubiquinone/menaquinone biosynthesis C-methylase UbiE
MNATAERKPKPYKGIAMEGMIATWYAKNTGKAIAEYRNLAKRIADGLRPGDSVLEVAPGPGYLTIELARLGCYRLAGLDISRTFIRIARENAARGGVKVSFQQGDVAAMPFADDAFDFIVCRAAFKNFGDPVGALCEMHRVLRPGGRLMIIDGDRDRWWGRLLFDGIVVLLEGQVRHLSGRAFRSLYRQTGFEEISQKRRRGPLPFLMTVGRAAKLSG